MKYLKIIYKIIITITGLTLLWFLFPIFIIVAYIADHYDKLPSTRGVELGKKDARYLKLLLFKFTEDEARQVNRIITRLEKDGYSNYYL